MSLTSVGRTTLWLGVFILLLACQYRFTNLQIQAPGGMHSIAVEAVYDTSNHVEPHEVLWLALQEGIIRDGNLLLVSKENADLYAQIHLQKSSHTPKKPVNLSEDTYSEVRKKYPASSPPHIASFPNLRITPKYSVEEAWAYLVTVEIYNLKEQKRIFAKQYKLAEKYTTYDPRGTLSSMFLAQEEKFEEDLKGRASLWGRQVIRDFLMSQG
ncbi:MAG: hypothetical protein OXT67_03755 [Zetaproteobacteria bacterium]|nr:hypothetical protein [Zetaproteobacteria bacterium]